MPLEFRRNEAVFNGSCAADEALQLADWLSRRKRPKINLAGCEHLHASLFQTLLTYKPALSASPVDPFLQRWLVPLLSAASESA